MVGLTGASETGEPSGPTATADGAVRETLEEANARVEIGPLYALYNIPNISQVYILFRARLLHGDVRAGLETLEARLFAENEIPWDGIAFATVRNVLTHYFDDRRQGEYRFHMGTIGNSSTSAASSATSLRVARGSRAACSKVSHWKCSSSSPASPASAIARFLGL